MIRACSGMTGLSRRLRRLRARPRLRALVVHHALVRRLATVSQLARRFGRSPSTLTESLVYYRQKMPELFERSPGPSITE